MTFETKHIGAYGVIPAKIIELTVCDGNATITADVTDLNHKVDENFIRELYLLADELQEHNDRVDSTRISKPIER